MSVTTESPAIVTANMATMFVSRNTGRADRQMHASVDPFQEDRKRSWGMSMMMEIMGSPITPTAVSIPSRSGTTSSVSRVTQTSMMGLRTSMRWAAGPRESWEDARVPRRRLRTGRTEKRRMSTRAEGTGVFAHKGIRKKGMCGQRWNARKRRRVSYTFPGHNSGRKSRDPVSQVRTGSGVSYFRNKRRPRYSIRYCYRRRERFNDGSDRSQRRRSEEYPRKGNPLTRTRRRAWRIVPVPQCRVDLSSGRERQ